MSKSYKFVGLTIVVGTILTLVSLLQLCSQQCVEGHKYTLFGYPFEAFGLIFFLSLGVIHYLVLRNPKLIYLEALMFASAMGAEVWFIYIQKFHIGHWCPVCLGIAATIFLGGGMQVWILLQQSKGNTMKKFTDLFTSSAALVVGFLAAFYGIAKFDPMLEAQDAIKENLAFGNKGSNIEVYLFTDWACPACRKLEPAIENMAPSMMKDVKFTFVDYVVHPETLNYIPYHLSFIINNKDQYFTLRHMLTEMSEETGSPSEEDVVAATEKVGANYEQLNYSDVAMGIKYFKKLGETFKISGTPTMVIINRDSKKGKKLQGNNEITQKNIDEAIKTLRQT